MRLNNFVDQTTQGFSLNIMELFTGVFSLTFVVRLVTKRKLTMSSPSSEAKLENKINDAGPAGGGES